MFFLIHERIKVDMSSVNYRDLRPLYVQALLTDDLTFCLHIADAQLSGLHGQCSDKSIRVSGSPGMDRTVKRPDDDDISFCYDSGSRFNIAKYDDARIRFQNFPSCKCFPCRTALLFS